MKKQLARFLIVSLLALSTISAGPCSKTTIVDRVDDVIFYLKEARPVIAQYLPGATNILEQGISIAERIRPLIIADNAGGSAQFLAELVPIVRQITEQEVLKIANPNTRTIIMLAFAGVDVALHYIVRQGMQNNTARQSTSRERMEAMRILVDYDATPVWGNKYKYKKRE